MALILFVGTDNGVLSRWVHAASLSGYDTTIVSPASRLTNYRLQAELCVYDLGARGGADTRALIDALNDIPDSRMVALTARPDSQEGLGLLKAGVRGYCNRLASSKVIAALLSTVESGEIWAGKQVTDYLLGTALAKQQTFGSAPNALFSELTARETEIARAVAAGRSNKVIAVDNSITERTVKAHLNNIFRKTGIRNRVQLALAVAQTEDDRRQLSNG